MLRLGAFGVAARATCASPITSGAVPNSLVRRTRSTEPPMLTCTVCRIVWFSKLVVLDAGTVVGAVAQVPTQVWPPPVPPPLGRAAAPGAGSADCAGAASSPPASRAATPPASRARRERSGEDEKYERSTSGSLAVRRRLAPDLPGCRQGLTAIAWNTVLPNGMSRGVETM